MSRQSCFVTAAVLVATASWGQSVAARSLDLKTIEPQPLAQALDAWARQTGLQLIYGTEMIKGRRSAGAPAGLSPGDALARILEGSGLKVTWLNDRTVAVLPTAEVIQSERGALSSEKEGVQGEGPSSPSEGGDQSLWTRFRLAQASQVVSTEATSVEKEEKEKASQQESGTLQEVIVTAQKKSERLQDVPVPVSVVDTQLLTTTNQVLLRDYYATVPGLNVTPNIEGNQVISIRGITTGGFTNPTVGISVDDVPFGASTNTGAGNQIPDFDPGDLARVEVLRGPQGTLYGDNSMGGLIKFVTVDPSPDRYSGRIEAGTSGVYNGAEPGFVVRASSNIPLSDSAAVKISAFSRQDPGYVDNVLTGGKGVNEAEVYGARLAFLWRPSADMSLKFSALYQDTKMDGQPDVIAGLGSLQQNYIPYMGESNRRIQAYELTLKAKLGIGELTSITAYTDTRYNDSLDLTYFYAPFTLNGCNAPGAVCPPNVTFNGFGVTGSPQFDYFRTEKVTQELRFLLPIGKNADWLIGAFYNHETNPDYQIQTAEDPVTGRSVGQWAYFGEPETFREFAAFTDFTYRFTDRFDVQIGGRESLTKETDYPNVTAGIFVPVFYGRPSPIASPYAEVTGNVFTYLLTPRFKLSPDVMVYARLASGYRPGGTNFGTPGVRPTYAPDKTEDYELGFKGEFLDNRLSLDASMYYISWKDLQLQLFTAAGTTYGANGSAAKSEGVELSARVTPSTGLVLSGWVDIGNAALTQPIPSNGSVYGQSGDRLPNSSRFSGNLSVQQNFPMGEAIGFAGAMVSYVGNRQGLFTGSPGVAAPRQLYPAYTKTDVSLGTEYESWRVSLYATNLFDQRGQISGGLGYFDPQAFTIIPPRTIGLSVVKTFGR